MDMDQNIVSILNQAEEGQEIILENVDEETETEEIIEIVEEIVEVYDEDDDNTEENSLSGQAKVEKTEQSQNCGNQKMNGVPYNPDITKKVIYASHLVKEAAQERLNNQYHYDASADWEDDDYEQDEQTNQVQHENQEVDNSNEYENYTNYNNGVTSDIADENQENENSRQTTYEHGVTQENSVDDNDSQQEIVQNAENNLVYTVLNTKKQGKQVQENEQTETQFVEVEKYKNSEVAEDGTIYYAVNEDGSYVTSVEDQQHYEYTNETPVEENAEWDESNAEVETQQEVTEQEQIFLHEDENGQLYFKNEQGELQPVYLTPDGNYALAEEEDQDAQEEVNQVQQESEETENYVLPDLDLQDVSKNRQNSETNDDEDDTMTMTLIISEDENGQKRTQVIIPTQPAAKCRLCNKTFKSSLQLLKHNRLKHAREEDITTRNFPCDLCPKRFTDQNSLARHRKLHTEDRPFQCLECQKTFPTANILRKHLSTHNPDSHPLPCIYCGRRFLDESSLMKHEQSHMAAEKKNHVCDICQKCFANNFDLNIHKKNHDPDRKFDCEVCGREFNRLNNLQRHMMVHQQKGANEEILSCNVCGITYKFSSSLTRHMVTTHMNPERLRQQAEEQRRKRENNYRRYLENRKSYETQQPKRICRRNSSRLMDDDEEDEEEMMEH
ncbi:hypothetical protein TKK_0007048 [Trichogramma kaykai]|uniref:C2H2-type domain-containing protein n=1 Tax=Trichogramma kaykai TaxID=54128 RepID=A0ABD2XA03_9HYME